jgi:hypothetical protein
LNITFWIKTRDLERPGCLHPGIPTSALSRPQQIIRHRSSTDEDEETADPAP